MSASISSTASSAASRVPHLIFLAPAPRPPRPSLCDAWRRAITRYWGPQEARRTVGIDVVEGRLDEVEPARLACDCVVSPANAFGIMDGG